MPNEKETSVSKGGSSGAPSDSQLKQSDEANQQAFQQANTDISQDPEAPASDPSTDLDEGELARYEHPE